MIERSRMEEVIREYYDGCNEADVEKMIGCFEEDAVHYFPAGAVQGTFVGRQAIAEGWASAVERLGSRWTIDRLCIDETTAEVAIEWTHWKTASGAFLRGVEMCQFGESGLISEIRAYYAACAPDPAASYELGDFDYAGRDYPLVPPDVSRSGV
jgi:hypothetical protein